MATGRDTAEGLHNWFQGLHLSPWKFPERVGPDLSADVLALVLEKWSDYDANVKLGLLFSFVSLKKLQLMTTKDKMIEILECGCRDPDEWVNLVSHMFKDFPTKGVLNSRLEEFVDGFAENVAKLKDLIAKNGVKFHPAEYAYLQKSICEAFLEKGSLTREKPPLKLTVEQHFGVKASYKAARSKRMERFKKAAPASTSATMPSTGTATTSSASPINTAPPSRPIPTGNSGIIGRPRRPSQPSFLLSKPPSRSSSGYGSGSGSSATSLSRLNGAELTVGKTFQKPKKIQMLDINEGTSIIRNQNEEAVKQQQEELQQREQRKKEREQRAEERRKEEEERKLQRERDKEERVRVKAEIKLTKEREKQAARAAAEAAAVAAVPVESPEGGPRKRQRTNTMDSDVSIGFQYENDPSYANSSHKQYSPTTVTPDVFMENGSPISPPPGAHMPRLGTFVPSHTIPQTSFTPTSPTSVYGNTYPPIPSAPSMPVVETPPNPVYIQSATPHQVQHVPAPSRAQDPNQVLQAVFEKTNALTEEDRQFIINFLNGQNERPTHLGNMQVHQIVMHEERQVDHTSGREIVEHTVFEMDFESGHWRKLRRKKFRSPTNPPNHMGGVGEAN